MLDEKLQELLHAWALDAVDPAEAAEVERAIREDPALAEEARALREVAALLAFDASAQPPVTLRDDVLERIARTPQESPATDHDSADDGGAVDDGADGGVVVDLGRFRARRRDRWLAAAVVLVAAAVPSVLAVQQNQRADDAEQQLAIVAEALTQPDAQLVGQDVTGGGRAVAVLSADTSVFSAQGLSTLAEDEDYQLWVVDESGARSVGVLTVAAGETSAEVAELPAGATIAMTVEPAGGSPQPTTDPIVALTATS